MKTRLDTTQHNDGTRAPQSQSIVQRYVPPQSTQLLTADASIPYFHATAIAFVILSSAIGPLIGSTPYILSGMYDPLFIYGFGFFPSLLGAMMFIRGYRKYQNNGYLQTGLQGAFSGVTASLTLGILVMMLSLPWAGMQAISILLVSLFVGLHGAFAGGVLGIIFEAAICLQKKGIST